MCERSVGLPAARSALERARVRVCVCVLSASLQFCFSLQVWVCIGVCLGVFLHMWRPDLGISVTLWIPKSGAMCVCACEHQLTVENSLKILLNSVN